MSETSSYSNNFSAIGHLFVANSNTSESISESESIVGICEDYLIDNESKHIVHETLTPIELSEQALLMEELQQEEEKDEFVGDAEDRSYYTNAAHNFYSAWSEHNNTFKPDSLQYYGINCKGKPINYVLRQVRSFGASLGVIQLSSMLSQNSSSSVKASEWEEHKCKKEKDEGKKSKVNSKRGVRTRSRSRNVDIQTCPTASATATGPSSSTNMQSTLSANNSERNAVNVHTNTNISGVNNTLRTHVVTAMERVRTCIIAQAHNIRRQQEQEQENQETQRENGNTNNNDDDNNEDNNPRITPLRHPSAPARPSLRYQHQEPFHPLSSLADANKRSSLRANGERSGMDRFRFSRSHSWNNSATTTINSDGEYDNSNDIHFGYRAHTGRRSVQWQRDNMPYDSDQSHLQNNDSLNYQTNNWSNNNSCNQRVVNTLFEPLLHGAEYKGEKQSIEKPHHKNNQTELVECKLDEEASWFALQHSSEWGHLICGEVHVEDWGSLKEQEHVKEQLHLASFLQLYAVILPIPVLSVFQLQVARVSPFDKTWSVFNELNTTLCCEVASILRDFIRACPSCKVWLKCDVREENLTKGNTANNNDNNSHLHQFHLVRRALLYGYTVEFNTNTNSAQYIIHERPFHASELEQSTNIDCIGKLAIVLRFPSDTRVEDWEDNKMTTEWLGEHIAAVELNSNAMLAYFRDGINSSNSVNRIKSDEVSKKKNKKVKETDEEEEESEEEDEEEEEEENATSRNRQEVTTAAAASQPQPQHRNKVVIATLKKEIEQQRLLSSYVNMNLLNNEKNETKKNGVASERPIRRRRQYHIPRSTAQLAWTNKNRIRWGSCTSFFSMNGNKEHSLYSPRISLFTLFIELLRRRAIPLLTLSNCKEEQPEKKVNSPEKQEENACKQFFEMYALVNYLHYKFVADDARDTFTPYEDVLQLPLQPLAHQLSNVVYEVFEKDTAKYRQYHMALMLYMKDWLVSSNNAQSDCIHAHNNYYHESDNNNYYYEVEHKKEETHHALINNAFLRSLRELHHSERESKNMHECSINSNDHFNHDNNEQFDDDNVMYVVVLGCGRGGLIHECLHAASSLGIRLRIFAIEKNTAAAAFTQMRWRHDIEWIQLANQYKHSLHVICADARYVYDIYCRNNNKNTTIENSKNINESGQQYVVLPADFGLCDLVLSELLGSWGDNELSPECLETFHDQLLLLQECKKIIPNRYLVSIPEHYTAWVAPVYSTYLEDAIAQASLRGLSQPPVNCPNRHVALYHSCFVCNITRAIELAPAQPVWTFHHFMHMEHMNEALDGCCANRGGGFANLSRRANVTFEMYPHGKCSGLLGFFTCTLYISRLDHDGKCCTNMNRNHNFYTTSKNHARQWNGQYKNEDKEVCECCVKLSTEPNSRTPDLYSWFPCFMPLEPYQAKSLSLSMTIPSQPLSLSIERTLRRQQRQEQHHLQYSNGSLLEQQQQYPSPWEKQRANSKSAYLQIHPYQINFSNNNNSLRRNSLCSITSQSSGSSNHTTTTSQYNSNPFTASRRSSISSSFNNTANTNTTTNVYNNSKSANTTCILPCAHNSKSASTSLTVHVERKVDFATKRVWYTWAVSYDDDNDVNSEENEENDDKERDWNYNAMYGECDSEQGNNSTRLCVMNKNGWASHVDL